MIIGAPFADVLGPGDNRGKVWCFAFNPTTGVQSVLTSCRGTGDIFLTNRNHGTAGDQDHFGLAVAHVRDFDGVFRTDIAVGAPGVDLPNDGQGGSAPDSGAVYIFNIRRCP